MRLATATPERWASEMRRVKAAGAISDDAPDNYEQIRQFVENDRYNVNLATNLHLSLELQIYKDILKYITHRKWMLLRSPSGQTGFITSDHPVCLTWSDRLRQGQFEGPGHGILGTTLIFPICDELTLMGSFEGAEGARDLTDAQVAAVNGVIAEHAERQIYARSGNFMYQFTHNEQIMKGNSFLNELKD